MEKNSSEYIFISYSRKDKSTMQKISRFLAENGIRCWIDENINASTKRWHLDLEKAISESKGMILLLSPDAKKSDWVYEELRAAQSRDKPIFPLLLSGSLADSTFFGTYGIQHIDMRYDWEIGSRKLLADLRKIVLTTPAPEQVLKNADDDTVVFPDTSVLVFTQEPSIEKIWSIVKNHLTEPEWQGPIIEAIRTSKHTVGLLEKLLKAEQNAKTQHFPLLIAASILSGTNQVDLNLRKRIVIEALNLIPSLPWQSPLLWDYSDGIRNVTGYDLWFRLAQIPQDEFLQTKFSDVMQDKKMIPQIRIGAAIVLKNYTALEGFALGEWGHGILHNLNAVTALFLRGEISRLKRIVSAPGLNHELGLNTAKYLILAKEYEFVEPYLFKVLKQLTSTDHTELFLIKGLFADLESREGLINIATNKIFSRVEQEDAIKTLVKLGHIDDAAGLYFDLAMSKTGMSIYNPYIVKLGELKQVNYLEKIVRSAKGKSSRAAESDDPLMNFANYRERMNDFLESIFDDSFNSAFSAVSELSKMGEIDKLKELSQSEEIHWMVKDRISSELKKNG